MRIKRVDLKDLAFIRFLDPHSLRLRPQQRKRYPVRPPPTPLHNHCLNEESKDILISFAVVASLVTTFRLSVRSPRKWGLDDLCAVIATLGMITQAVVLGLRFRNVPCEFPPVYCV